MQANLRGNHKADELADIGVIEGHFAGTYQLAGYYARKHIAYQNLIHRIHAMILRVLKAEKEARESMEAARRATELAEGRRTKVRYKALAECWKGPKFGEGHTMQLLPLQEDHFHKDQVEAARHIHCFLSNIQLQPAEPGTNGAAWHELLAVFQLKGGRLRCATDACQIGSSLRQHIMLFKKLTRAICAKYGGIHGRDLYKPARSKEHRLADYGIVSHIPCVVGNICLGQADAKQHHEAMAALAGWKNTQQACEQLHSGQARVVERKVRQRGKAPWLHFNITDSIPTLATKQFRKSLAMDVVIKQSGEIVPKPQLDLQCQRCNTTRILVNRPPITNGTWAKIACGTCNTSTAVNKWHCTCGTQWHTCTTHAPIGLAIRKCETNRTTMTTRKHRFTKRLTPLGQPKHTPPTKTRPEGSSSRCTTTTDNKGKGKQGNNTTPSTRPSTERPHQHTAPTPPEEPGTGQRSLYLKRYLESGVVQSQPKMTRTVAKPASTERTSGKGKRLIHSVHEHRQLQTERLVKRLKQTLATFKCTAGAGGAHDNTGYVDSSLVGAQGQHPAKNPAIDITGINNSCM